MSAPREADAGAAWPWYSRRKNPVGVCSVAPFDNVGGRRASRRRESSQDTTECDIRLGHFLESKLNRQRHSCGSGRIGARNQAGGFRKGLKFLRGAGRGVFSLCP